MKNTKQQNKERFGHEDVLVVPSFEVNALLPEGFSFFGHDGNVIVNTLLRKSVFERRFQMEGNPRYRQWIPYVVIKHGDLIYSTKRLKKSGEGRLWDKLSIGQGGHINHVDSFLGNIISNNVARELAEELDIYSNCKVNIRRFGFLNIINPNNPVSNDHLGIVMIMDVSKPTRKIAKSIDGQDVVVEVPSVRVRETEKLQGDWVTYEWLRENYEYMELWSQKVFDVLERMKG